MPLRLILTSLVLAFLSGLSTAEYRLIEVGGPDSRTIREQLRDLSPFPEPFIRPPVRPAFAEPYYGLVRKRRSKVGRIERVSPIERR